MQSYYSSNSHLIEAKNPLILPKSKKQGEEHARPRSKHYTNKQYHFIIQIMFGQSSVLFLVCLSSSVCSLIAFTPSPSQIRHHTRFGMSNDDDEKETEIPCLPPIGESSFTGEVTNNDDSEVFRIGSEKFELQYTCNVCETRNFHKVSRMAYRNGIVITVCKKFYRSI